MEKGHGRGGNRKAHAPEGYYTALQACQVLSIGYVALGEYVGQGIIEKFTPIGKKNSWYVKKSVDTLAQQIAEESLTLITQSQRTQPGVIHRWATPYDLPGVNAVMESFGWESSPVSKRQKWLELNPYSFYVARYKTLIVGYISCMAHPQNIIEDLMAGRIRGKDIKPWENLPFVPRQENIAYFGASMRRVPAKRYYAGRLLREFFHDLGVLSRQQGIVVQTFYGMSDEEDGQSMADTLGAIPLPSKDDDIFGIRYKLDLRTSESKVITRYRESWLHS